MLPGLQFLSTLYEYLLLNECAKSQSVHTECISKMIDDNVFLCFPTKSAREKYKFLLICSGDSKHLVKVIGKDWLKIEKVFTRIFFLMFFMAIHLVNYCSSEDA